MVANFMDEDADATTAAIKSNVGEFTRPTRDWFLILLTGSAGSVDAAIFLKSHVFTANMTGNTVILGLALARLEPGSVAMTLFALCGFCVGAALAAWIVKTPEIGWSRRLNRALSTAAALLLVGGVAVSTPGCFGIPVAVSLVAAAMGMQSASVQHLAVGGISTNVITSTLTTAVTRLVSVLPLSRQSGAKFEDPQLHISCWCSYLLGAVVGGVTSPISLWVTFGLSVFLMLAIVTVSRYAIKRAR